MTMDLAIIPEVVWAALLGSLLTLVGVVINNRHHRTEQNAQREHDSAERERQRKFETRASVYLAAAGEMAKANQHLGNLPNLDLAENNLGDILSGFTASTTQAILIATDNASEAINNFLVAFAGAFFRLLPRILGIQSARADRDIQESLHNTYHTEVQRIVATMTHLNETRTTEQADWDVLNRNLEFNRQQAKEAADLRSQAATELNHLTIEYMDSMIGESKAIMRASLPALVAIRSDLEISSDINAYRVQFEKRLAQMEELIKDFKDEVQRFSTDQAD